MKKRLKKLQETQPLLHSPSYSQRHTCENALLGKYSHQPFSKLLLGQVDLSIFLSSGKAHPSLPPLLKTTYTDYPVVQTRESNLLVMKAVFYFRHQILIVSVLFWILHTSSAILGCKLPSTYPEESHFSVGFQRCHWSTGP